MIKFAAKTYLPPSIFVFYLAVSRFFIIFAAI